MRGQIGLRSSTAGRGWLIGAAFALIVIATVGPAAGEMEAWELRHPCTVEGSWIASVDIGAVFFVSYSRGATGTGGAMAIEWIGFDPTLFGSFPDAVRTSQAIGAWRQTAAFEYRYTWIVYGFNALGVPLYSVRGSGTGSFPGCNAIVFDYVLEVFPYPLDPLVDDPVDCLSGTGSKSRIPVVEAACDS